MSRKRGGKYVARGAFGCVFNPQLKCAGEAEVKADSISKLIAKQYQAEEMIGKDLFEPIDPEKKYFLYPDRACAPQIPPPENIGSCNVKNSTGRKLGIDYSNRVVIQIEDGGKDLISLKLVSEDYGAFFNSINNLLEGFKKAKDAGLSHNDIKVDNIVTKKLADGSFSTRYIDFGFACKSENFRELSLMKQLVIIGFNNDYPYYISPDRMLLLDRYVQYNVARNMYEFKDEINGHKFDKVIYYNYLINNDNKEIFTNINTIHQYYQNISINPKYFNYSNNFPINLYNSNDFFNKIKDHPPEFKSNSTIENFEYLYKLSQKNRYKEILYKSDLFSLGLAIISVYYNLTGHRWFGNLDVTCGECNNISIYVIGKNDWISLDKKYSELDHITKININEASFNKHKQIMNKISKRYYNLFGFKMMHPYISDRPEIEYIIAEYTPILYYIKKYLTKDNIDIMAAANIIMPGYKKAAGAAGAAGF